MEWILSLKTLKARELINMKLFCGGTLLGDLGSIRYVRISMVKDAKLYSPYLNRYGIWGIIFYINPQ